MRSWPLNIWEISDTFCDFSSWFFSLLRYCAGMHDGKWEGNSFLPTLFIILWTNSSRVIGKGEGMKGKGEHRIRAPTVVSFFVCFIWLLKIMIYKRAGEKRSLLAVALTHLKGLDFSQDDKQLEGPNDWMCLAVIGCHLTSQIDELQWEWVGRLQIKVLGSYWHCGDHAVSDFMLPLSTVHNPLMI